MKKKTVFGTVLLVLFVLQAQTVFAADYYDDFRKELNRNNIRNIEQLLERRAKQMNLVYCMTMTLGSRYVQSPSGFNKSNCLDVLRLLVHYGADVNKQYIENSATNIEHRYPLENAIDKEHSLSVIQFLLDSGANPNLSSDDLGVLEPPILRAYRKNNTAAVNLLLDRGANGAVILRSAGSRGDNEIIRLLISQGVQIRSDQGAEALRWAARGGHFDTIKLLVENGVNVNARNNEGKSALNEAYDKGEMEIYNYLKANGAIDFEPRQVAQPAAPAPSSTTNVYVQPSAPAQSAPTPAPVTPTLRPGRYACSGTNVTMEIQSPLLFVTLYSGYSTVGNGSYKINGNTIIITISQANDVIKHMRGMTYAYTILSDTSFSGSGETWYRR
jgi:hypothetical protein